MPKRGIPAGTVFHVLVDEPCRDVTRTLYFDASSHKLVLLIVAIKTIVEWMMLALSIQLETKLIGIAAKKTLDKGTTKYSERVIVDIVSNYYIDNLL